jgi:DNA-binding NtrC family response regulator
VDTAVAAMKEGAQEYMVKPCNPNELSLLVERVLRVQSLQRENLLLRKKLEKQYTFHGMTSKNATMHEIFELVRNVGRLKSTVLIQGESGTGKEMVARAIHACSDRADRPFVAVPCTALAETLLETELFGHERGAFTGAVERKQGKFEQAHGGTLLLDEIGDITPKLQVELLRVLQERRFFRVGGSDEIAVDVRVIAASNRNLQEAVEGGTFRDDLFYRLNVVAIHLPPLRERIEDVPLLARTLLGRISADVGKEVTGLTDAALRLLVGYDWPGNVRELENAVERAVAVAQDAVLDEEDFAFLHRRTGAWTPPPEMTLRDVERRVIETALRRAAGNVTAAAESLGIDRSTLYDKLKRYGIRRADR